MGAYQEKLSLLKETSSAMSSRKGLQVACELGSELVGFGGIVRPSEGVWSSRVGKIYRSRMI